MHDAGRVREADLKCSHWELLAAGTSVAGAVDLVVVPGYSAGGGG